MQSEGRLEGRLALVYCISSQEVPKISTAMIKGRRLGSARLPPQSSDTFTKHEGRLVKVQEFKEAFWSEDLIGLMASPIQGTPE